MKTITKCTLKLAGVDRISGVLHASDTAETSTWSERNPIVFWGDRANEDWSYVDNLE